MQTKALIALACVCTALSACGPIYDTQYSFIPPKNSQGRICIGNCDNLQMQCRHIEDMRVSQCEQQSRLDRDLCERELRLDEDRSAKWYECTGISCTSDYTLCESQYRNCFQSCGGEVRAETRCVANCDQIPPHPTSRGRAG